MSGESTLSEFVVDHFTNQSRVDGGDFSADDAVFDKLIIGEKMQVYTHGVGLELLNVEGVEAMNMSPYLMEKLTELGMGVTEAITAVTLNAAAAIGQAAELGSIEVGKRADLVVLEAPNYHHIVYHYGVNPVRHVIKNGRVVVSDGDTIYS